MTPPHDDLPDAPTEPGLLLDARLHLLDRQLLDRDGEPVGIVDDLDLDLDTGVDLVSEAPTPTVTGVLTGQVLVTRILGGTPPRSRLQPLSWRLVAAIGTVVRLDVGADEISGLWVEHWLRDHVVGRIPGGRHAAQ